MLLHLTLLIGVALAADEPKFQYPEYCAKSPLDPKSRQSPPLSAAAERRNLTLKSVQLVFRHGARSPVFYEPCWKNFNQTWSCDYGEQIVGYTAGGGSKPTVAFNKKFDALPSGNAFHGTCQLGQLLPEGARQLQQIGQLIAESYLIENSSAKLPRPGTKPLFSLEELKEKLYFRTTDTQRTTNSGMNLISGMLRTAFGDKVSFDAIDMHTTEFGGDYLVGNDNYCPPLDRALKEYFSGIELHGFRKVSEVIIESMIEATGVKYTRSFWGQVAVDCIMPTICEGRWDEFPDGLNPIGPDSANAQRLLGLTEDLVNIDGWSTYQHNSGEISKYSASLVMKLMKQSIQDIMNNKPGAPTLNLWSTHDTTITSVLYNLATTRTNLIKFPPYASLITLELYENPADGSYWFRTIYNGEVFTNGVKHCAEDVCEIEKLMEHLSWVDETVEKCTREQVTKSISETYNERYLNGKSTTTSWLNIPYTTIAISTTAGFLIGFFIKSFCCVKKRSRLPTYERD